MKSTILGVMVALGVVSSVPGAMAQGWGYGGGYGGGYARHGWEEDRWQRRAERREFWRERREMMERRAYEAGRRDAWQRQNAWGYR